MAATQYNFTVGDGGSKLRVTIVDQETQDAIDLTGKTAKLRYQVNALTVVERDMIVLNQATNKGQADYQFLPADLTVAGEMKVEVCLQEGASDQLTTVDTLFLQIKAPLA